MEAELASLVLVDADAKRDVLRQSRQRAPVASGALLHMRVRSNSSGSAFALQDELSLRTVGFSCPLSVRTDLRVKTAKESIAEASRLCHLDPVAGLRSWDGAVQEMSRETPRDWKEVRTMDESTLTDQERLRLLEIRQAMLAEVIGKLIRHLDQLTKPAKERTA